MAAILLSPACSKQSESNDMLRSSEEIAFRLPEWTPTTQSRASLFEGMDDLRKPGKGGGNFTFNAYVDGTDNIYIKGARAWYFDDPKVQKWVFLNDVDALVSHYWPRSGKLNFFAYMPDARYNGKDGYIAKETYVTVDADSYTETGGQTFRCDLPQTIGYDTKTQEFIYAYAESQSKEANNPVELRFKHPFAAINFKVAKDSYRMSIENIEFSDIHLAGEFSTADPVWKPAGEAVKYTARINKRIPNDVNYNTLLDEHESFLVMPQKLDGVTLTLVAYRDVDNETTPSINETVALSGEWLPGMKYIYTIKIGDNNSEIYFDVEVEEQAQDDWIAAGENNIDVE